MIAIPTEFRAQLESFRGPLDLLLYLIRKDEIEIADIPIAHITNQYLVFLEILKQVDPNACGEFLVMAANLMEIKSRMLLPQAPLEEGEVEELEDPRLELVLQLLEYKKYKERALLLERMVHEHSLRFERPEEDVPDLERRPLPLSLGKVSIWDLLTAFQRVQMALELRQPHRILYEDRPVEEYIAAVEERLDEMDGTELPFESLFESCEDRYELIGFFLAILEMAKRGLILFSQESVFGDIRITRRPAARVPEDEAMRAASLEAVYRPETSGTEPVLEAAAFLAETTASDNEAAPSRPDPSASAASGADLDDLASEVPPGSEAERPVLRVQDDDDDDDFDAERDDDDEDYDGDDDDEDYDEDYDGEGFEDEEFDDDDELDGDFDDDEIADFEDDEFEDDEDELDED